MNRDAFLTFLAVEVQELEAWLAQKWLVPAQTGADVAFSEADIARARLIQDLKRSFGVNDPGIDVILHLLDQLHGFRRAFEGMHENLHAPR